MYCGYSNIVFYVYTDGTVTCILDMYLVYSDYVFYMCTVDPVTMNCSFVLCTFGTVTMYYS